MSGPPATRPIVLLLDVGNTLAFLDHNAVSLALADAEVTVSGASLSTAEPKTAERYQARLEQGAPHDWSWFMQSLLEDAGLDSALAQTLVPTLKQVHEKFNFWRRVPEGTADALDRIRAAGVRTAVVSNSEGKLDTLFEQIGLLDRVEFIVDSAREGVCKPDPEIFYRALRKLRVEAEHTVYAGDLPTVDVAGARAAGIHPVLIDPRAEHVGLDVWRATSVVEVVDQLLALPSQQA